MPPLRIQPALPRPALAATHAPGVNRLILLALAVLLAYSDYAVAADKKAAPPARPAAEYTAFDAHPTEHVTIAADPCTLPADCPFFRLPYLQHGFLPIRVVVTNDGDRAVSLDDARIQFISANNDVIPAATDDDLNRRLFTMKSVHGTKIPMPAPIPAITIHHPPVDKKILEDDTDFGFPGTVVNAHSTLSGYLFYDIRPLDDPALKNAELYVKMVHTLDAKQDLFAFSIPFNKWLAAHPAAIESNTPEKKK
jgi:hypothetical protein